MSIKVTESSHPHNSLSSLPHEKAARNEVETGLLLDSSPAGPQEVCLCVYVCVCVLIVYVICVVSSPAGPEEVFMCVVCACVCLRVCVCV